MEKKDLLYKLADEIHDTIVDIRRHLHMHPELSFNEENTSAFIRKQLDSWNIEYEYPFVKHGILARVNGKTKEGSVLALRSDMDALPILEENDTDFKSLNDGIMHACGHDVHMASLLGAAYILSRMSSEFSGTVLFIFQPGEEKLPGGAKLMMEEGLFNNAKPDLILAQHVLPEMESGTVGFKPGMYMASSDEIYLTVKGKGGHGALPERINDPILMAANILITLQQEINRRSPKGIPTVLSFGKFIADGAVNVIPDIVKLEGTFRTMNESWRKKAHDLINQISSGIAAGMGGDIELEIKHGYPVLHNNEEISAKAKNYAIELLGSEHVEDMNIRMTAEDFAWFSNAYPSMLYRLGVKPKDALTIQNLHTSTFSADEGALKTGMTTMSWLALRFLSE